jgi:cellulose synthase/poly-beta-1,6-N-acetylglucosamine synthase-like glycosyltransferase
MRKPKGHFNLDGVFTDLVLFVGIPVFSIVTFVILLILRIWCSFSGWWLLFPVGVFTVWLAFVRIMSRE